MWKIIEINMDTNREYIDVIVVWNEAMIFVSIIITSFFEATLMVVSFETTSLLSWQTALNIDFADASINI